MNIIVNISGVYIYYIFTFLIYGFIHFKFSNIIKYENNNIKYRVWFKSGLNIGLTA